MRKIEPRLSVVIPTRNECDNIPTLLATLADAMAGVATEVIFVDDSDDTTPEVIAAQAAASPPMFRVRLHHRSAGPERTGGLATAVSVGMSIARAKYVAVLDADLQHPPEQLRTLFDEAVETDADVVLATRYLPGGGYEGLDGPSRKLISMGLKWVAKIVFPDQLLRVSDPLGGFFLVRRAIIEGVKLRPIGYKISLELLVRCTWVRLVEVPYHFHARTAGQSKADFKQGMMVLRHMGRLVREVPAGARFWKFFLVGLSGVVVNLALFALFQHAHARPWLAIAAATEISILSNFALNVVWTWRDLPKRGRRDLLTRTALYHGAVAPVVAVYLSVSAFLAHYREPSVPTQVLSLIPALFLSYWLARRVVFAPRESWASLFRRPSHPLTVQEALDGVLPEDEEADAPELPASGLPHASQ